LYGLPDGDAIEYCVTVKEDSTPDDIPVFMGCDDGIFTSDTSYTLSVSLEPAKTYWWAVWAKDELGNWSEDSEWWSFTTTTAVDFDNNEEYNVKLLEPLFSWRRIDNAVEYYLLINKDLDRDVSIYNGKERNEFISQHPDSVRLYFKLPSDIVLESQTSYWWTVVAVDEQRRPTTTESEWIWKKFTTKDAFNVKVEGQDDPSMIFVSDANPLKTYPFSVSILSDYAVDNWTLYADLGSFYGNVDLSTPHIPIPAAEEVIIGLELTPWESNGEYSFTIYFMGSNGEVLGGLPVFVVIDNKTAIDFTPKIDGFRFRNLCTERFEEMFIDYYGRNNVLLPDGDLRLTAREWYDKRYQKCIGGASCFGFSQQFSLWLFCLDFNKIYDATLSVQKTTIS